MTNLLLAAVVRLQVIGSTTSTAAANTGISTAFGAIDNIFTELAAGLFGIFLICWVVAHLIGGVFNMFGGLPWFSQHSGVGADLHARANHSFWRVAIGIPLMLFLAGIVIQLTSSVTGVHLPMSLTSLNSIPTSTG